MRQRSGGDDLSFAQIFSNSDSVDKDLIYRIQNYQTDKRLKYIQYSNLNDLEKIFFEELAEVLNMTKEDDIDAFNKSLGAEKMVNIQIIILENILKIGKFYLLQSLWEWEVTI